MKRVLILTAFILLLPVWAWGATYYVADSAAGDGSGDSYANRMSVASHNADTYTAGDVIYLCGTIPSRVTPPNSGSGGTYITYYSCEVAHGASDDDAATLTRGSTWSFGGIGKSYIKIIGCAFSRPAPDHDDRAVRFEGGGGYIWVESCTFTDIGWGIDLVSLTDGHNTLKNNTMNGVSNGIYLQGRNCGTRTLIASNTIDNTNYDELYAGDGHSIAIQGAAYTIVRDNEGSRGIRSSFDMWCHDDAEPMDRNVVYNNIFRDFKKDYSFSYYGHGTTCTGESSAGAELTGNIYYNNVIDTTNWGFQDRKHTNNPGTYFFNNTIYDAGDGGLRPQDYTGYNTYKNNIVSHSDTKHVYSGGPSVANMTFDYNLYYPDLANGWQLNGTTYANFAAWQAAGHDTNSIIGDPKYADAPSGDFTLESDSAAIDAGFYLTNVEEVGAHTVITVANADWFHDGHGIPGEVGSLITFYDGTYGLQNRTVTKVDYEENEITVASTDIIYNAGSPTDPALTTQVALQFVGVRPDCGANEYTSPPQNTAPYVTVYSPGGDITIYADIASTITASCTAVDDQSDTITYLWTLPNSDKDGSTDEDPGTVTFTCGAYPCSHSCSLKVTDDPGGLSNTYSFTVTHNETSVDDYSDITFWWRCESTTLDSKLDYSAGDTTGAADGTPGVTAAAHKYGTNGLDCPAGDDAVYRFVPVSDDIVGSAEGRAGFWIDANVWNNEDWIGFYIYDDADNVFNIRMIDGDEIYFKWKDNGTVREILTSTNANIDNTYNQFVEVAWKTSTNYREFFVNGVSKGSSSDLINSFAGDLVRLDIGRGNGAVSDIYQDNIMISNDSTRDLYALSAKTYYPGTPVCTKIYGITADGTYGIDDTIVIATEFDRPNDVNTGGGTAYLTVETGANDLKLEYLSGDNTTVLQWGTKDAAGYKIIADMVSADLTISGNITLNGMTMDAPEDLSTYLTDGSLAANSAIVIDTTSPDFSLGAFFHCDNVSGTADSGSTTTLVDDSLTQAEDYWNSSAIIVRKAGTVYYGIITDFVAGTDTLTVTMYESVTIDNTCTYDLFGAEIAAETTYVAEDICNLCVRSDGDVIFFNEGPTSNLKIGTDMSYPDKEEFEYSKGIETTVLLFSRVIQIGDRDVDLQAEGTAEDTGLIHGATKLIDAGNNEVIYTLPQADPDGGNIIISAPYPTGTPKEFDATNTMQAWITGGGYPIADDFFDFTADGADAFDVSAYDGVSGHPIELDGQGYTITGNQTYGDYYIIKRFIHGSTVVLGANDTHKYSLIPEGDILQVPENATGCDIRDDTIRGTLDLDETVGVKNTFVTTVDLAGIGAGETATFNDCAFVQSEAAIDATLGAGATSYDAGCQFSVNTTLCFKDYAGADFNLRRGSPFLNAGGDTGADVDILGETTPAGLGYDIGAYEFVERTGGRPMGLGLSIKGGFCPFREDE